MNKFFSGAVVSALAFSPAVQALPATGLSGGNTLFSFDTAAPSSVTGVKAITGLLAGETLFGIDYRPAGSVLYGLGSTGALYTIDAATGSATTGPTLTTALNGVTFSISFNPVADRLRVVSDTGQNLRINVDTGATTVDGTIAYAAGDSGAGSTPVISGVGYTMQLSVTPSSTTLYDIDSARNVLTSQIPPNSGTLNTVGSLGVTGLNSLEIDGGTSAAFASTASGFYSVNLTSGGASLIGSFGIANVTDFALAPTAVPEPMTLALLGAGLLGLVASRRRAR